MKNDKHSMPCEYFKGRDKANEKVSWEPMDIEELHAQGQDKMFCPYFLSKDRVSAADVIFMPYNYIIDPKIRENF